MNITFSCPRCDRTHRAELAESRLTCPHCQWEAVVPAALPGEGRVERCLVCRSGELFIRKDFSQRLGLSIITVGFIASSVAWFYYQKYLTFAILFATALADVVLYLLMPNLLECYHCHAQYRRLRQLDDHEPFDLQTHERHRQQRIRLRQATQRQARPAEPAGGPRDAQGSLVRSPADDHFR